MFTRYSVLVPNNVCTIGVKDECDTNGVWWLLDLIDSHRGAYRGQEFLSTALTVKKPGGPFDVVIENGNDHVLARQTEEYTDYPHQSLKLFSALNELGGYTHMLPGEY